MAKDIDLLDKLINTLSAEEVTREATRKLAVDFNSGVNRRTYSIDPLYASVLGPSFTVMWNMSPMTVYCDGIERPITKEHYQALQTYLQFQREQTRSRSIKSQFDGQTVVGDYRRIK